MKNNMREKENLIILPIPKDEKAVDNYGNFDTIREMIYCVRNCRIMVDADLAYLYRIENKYLKRTVRANMDRYPPDFMFELSKDELKSLRCKNCTSNNRGGNRYPTMAFTQEGIAMLSGLLRTPVAIQMNINIMRAFVAMRDRIATLSSLEVDRERILHRMDNLDYEINNILRDYHDLSFSQEQFKDEVDMQLELINYTLAELKSKLEIKPVVPANPVIGFKYNAEEK